MVGIGRISIAFAGGLIACAFQIVPAASAQVAAPGCAQWNVNGKWDLVQSNRTTVKMDLQQTGTLLKGSASYHSYSLLPETGQVVGSTHGASFEVTIYWHNDSNSNNSVGVYTGQVGPQGLAVGRAYDKTDPGTTADWHSDRYFACAATYPPLPGAEALAAKLAAASKPPPKALGRVETTGPRDPNMTMCDYARSAKARNSPAAPALEKRCLEGGGSMMLPPPPPPAPVAAPDLDALAAVGAAIAQQDPAVAEARNAEAGAFYQLGFDIASGLFGDPALGAAGNTVMGPGSEAIRASLSAAGQRGFDASVKFHQARDYKH